MTALLTIVALMLCWALLTLGASQGEAQPRSTRKRT